MEEDRVAEVLAVAEAARSSLELLNLRVDRFAGVIRRATDHGVHDSREVLLHHACDLANQLEPGAQCPGDPLLPAALDGTATRVAPQSHRGLLDTSSTRGLHEPASQAPERTA